MKGFKNSTKTSYDTASGRKFANGGMVVSRNDTADGQGPMNKPAMVAKYAKGGAVSKGEKKIGRVMTEFTEGKLHSGSKEGPKVKSTKQAVAIALNEARAAGAKIPRVKKAYGGMMDEGVSTRPVDKKGRRMTMDEMNTPERILRKSGQADPYEKMPKDAMKVKPRSITTERITVSESGPETALQKRLGRQVTKAEMDAARSARGKGSFRSIPLVGAAMDALGMKKGGLSAMPKGKGGKC